MKTISYLALLIIPLVAFSFKSREAEFNSSPAEEAKESKTISSPPEILPAPSRTKVKIVKKEKTAPTPLSLAMESGNLCETRIILNKENPLSKEHTPAILESIGASADLQSILAADGIFFGSIENKAPKNNLEKLVLALRASNLAFYAPLIGKENNDLSLKLLDELWQQDSSNAFYLLLKLSVLAKADKKNQMLATARLIEGSTKFENPLLSAIVAEERNIFISSAHYMVLSQIFPGVANIAYYTGLDVLVSLSREHRLESVRNLGEILLEKSLRSSERHSFDGLEDYLFDALPARFSPSREGFVHRSWPNIYYYSPDIDNPCGGDVEYEKSFAEIRARN